MAHRQRRVPYYFGLTLLGRHRALVSVDAFFVPADLSRRIEATQRAYLDWWIHPDTPERRWFPRRGLIWGGVRDYVGFHVLREHAMWWVGLLDACAPFTYNPWGPDAERQAIEAAERWSVVAPIE
jgi:hypothetical protein